MAAERKSPRWIVFLTDGTEWSSDDVEPWEVPLTSPVHVIVQPCVIMPDGEEMAQSVLVNYTHHIYYANLLAGDGERGLWLGHGSDSDVVRALQHFGPHVATCRSSVTTISQEMEYGTPGFLDAWAKARAVLGRR